jgi:hypothetical protein
MLSAQTSGHSALAGTRPPLIADELGTHYDGMLYATLQQLRSSSGSGVMLALTSTSPGDGVTHSVQVLINTLSRDETSKILRLESCQLSDITCSPKEIAQCCQQVDSNLYEFIGAKENTGPKAAVSWVRNWEYRRDCIEQFRLAFDYVLIDCPALNSSGDVLSLAPLINGVILVVQANKTRVDQLEHAERSLEFARGRLIGHILNKRTYNVPQWLYKRL